MTLRAFRLAAILLPASLALHELAFALAGGGLIGAHGYLELLVPASVALAASASFATLIAPALGAPGAAPSPSAPFALAGALLAVFVLQETAEATLLGGGMEALTASAAVAWLAPPLALVFGALSGGMIVALERTGEHLATLPDRVRHLCAESAPVVPLPARLDLELPAGTGLAFGFSRRPPPARGAHP